MDARALDPWDRLDDVERRIAALEAERLRAVADIAAMWPDDLAVGDPASDLARRYGISRYEAEERLRMAAALRELPDIARAHREGRLSSGQLRWVSRFATVETDAFWAEKAPHMSPARLRHESRRQSRASREQAGDDHAQRYVWTAWDERGRVLSMEGRLGAEQGAALEDAIRGAERDVGPDPDADDPKGARQADALLRLVTSPGSARPTLVVHADADVLAGITDGSRKLAETGSGIQLRAETIRRIACDAKVRIALEREGAPVGVVTSGRHVSPQQWELLEFRDRGCTYPGCDARRHLNAHHIRHWADGGRTTLGNLTLLCGRHHRMLHEGGWSIRGTPPDGLEFVDRWGAVRGSEALARAG